MNSDSIFGHSIFGDAVFTSSNPARPVWINSPAYPHEVPVGGTVKVQQVTQRLVPTTQVMRGSIPIPGVQPIPPGAAYPVGATVSVTQVDRRMPPVTRVSTGYTPIGPQRVVYGRPQPMPQHQYKNRPGIFHMPPEIGAFRYQGPHNFGPPVLGGFGLIPPNCPQGSYLYRGNCHPWLRPPAYVPRPPHLSGYGASPDGLGAFDGLIGFG